MNGIIYHNKWKQIVLVNGVILTALGGNGDTAHRQKENKDE